MALSDSSQPANLNATVRNRSLLNMVIVADTSQRGDQSRDHAEQSENFSKDFEAYPRSSVLCLRQDIVDALYAVGGRTLTDLLSLVEERPGLLLNNFPQWNEADLSSAVLKMKQELRGVVADHVLNFGIDSMRVALAVRSYESSNSSRNSLGGDFKL